MLRYSWKDIGNDFNGEEPFHVKNCMNWYAPQYSESPAAKVFGHIRRLAPHWHRDATGLSSTTSFGSSSPSTWTTYGGRCRTHKISSLSHPSRLHCTRLRFSRERGWHQAVCDWRRFPLADPAAVGHTAQNESVLLLHAVVLVRQRQDRLVRRAGGGARIYAWNALLCSAWSHALSHRHGRFRAVCAAYARVQR